MRRGEFSRRITENGVFSGLGEDEKRGVKKESTSSLDRFCIPRGPGPMQGFGAPEDPKLRIRA